MTELKPVKCERSLVRFGGGMHKWLQSLPRLTSSRFLFIYHVTQLLVLTCVIAGPVIVTVCNLVQL